MVSGAAKGIATWLVTTPEGRATLVKAANLAQETASHARQKAKANAGRPRGQRRGGTGVKKGSGTKKRR